MRGKTTGAPADRSPARTEMAEAINLVQTTTAALKEAEAKIASVTEEIYSVHRDVEAVEAEYPATRAEIDVKQAKIEKLNSELEELRRTRSAFEAERDQLKTSLGNATYDVTQKARAVLEEQAPILRLAEEFTRMREEIRIREAELDGLIFLAGYQGDRCPQELVSLKSTPWGQPDETRANVWRTWVKALETDPDAPMPVHAGAPVAA